MKAKGQRSRSLERTKGGPHIVSATGPHLFYAHDHHFIVVVEFFELKHFPSTAIRATTLVSLLGREGEFPQILTLRADPRCTGPGL